MSYSASEKERIQRICRHEIGHLIAAKEMRFNTGGLLVEVSPPLVGDHRASYTIEPWTPGIRNIDGVIEYLERRLVVLYAGVIAESLDAQGNYDPKYADKEWKERGGRDDFAKIQQLLQVLRNVRFPETTDPEKINKELKELGDGCCQSAGNLMLEKLDVLFGTSNIIAEKIVSYGQEFAISEEQLFEIEIFRNQYNELSQDE